MRKLLYRKFFVVVLFLFLFNISSILAGEGPNFADGQQLVVTTTVGDSRHREANGQVYQKSDFLSGWLRMLDSLPQSEDEAGKRVTVVSFASRVPGDITTVLKESGGEKGLWGVARMCLLSMVSIAIGYLAMLWANRAFQKYITRLQAVNIPNDQLWAKITVSLLHLIPKCVELFIVGIVSTVFFVLTVGWISVHNKMLFQLLLGTFLITRFVVFCTRAAFSADDAGNRLISIPTELVTPIVKIVGSTFSIVFIGVLFIRYFRGIGRSGANRIMAIYWFWNVDDVFDRLSIVQHAKTGCTCAQRGGGTGNLKNAAGRLLALSFPVLPVGMLGYLGSAGAYRHSFA